MYRKAAVEDQEQDPAKVEPLKFRHLRGHNRNRTLEKPLERSVNIDPTAPKRTPAPDTAATTTHFRVPNKQFQFQLQIWKRIQGGGRRRKLQKWIRVKSQFLCHKSFKSLKGLPDELDHRNCQKSLKTFMQIYTYINDKQL